MHARARARTRSTRERGTVGALISIAKIAACCRYRLGELEEKCEETEMNVFPRGIVIRGRDAAFSVILYAAYEHANVIIIAQ